MRIINLLSPLWGALLGFCGFRVMTAYTWAEDPWRHMLPLWWALTIVGAAGFALMAVDLWRAWKRRKQQSLERRSGT